MLAPVALAACAALPSCGFGVCGDGFFEFHVFGVVREQESAAPVVGARIGITLLSDARVVARSEVEDENAPTTSTLGEFDERFEYSVGNCVFPVPGSPDLSLPDLTPDMIRVIVVRDGCREEFAFDVNIENFVDSDAPDGVLRLREPIVVPACEP
jgi:hypothetical protein